MELQSMTVTGGGGSTPRVSAAGSDRGAQPPPATPGASPLAAQRWLRALADASPGTKLVYDSHGDPSVAAPLYEELSADHLFLSLIEHRYIRDMAVLYAKDTRTVHTAIRLGIQVCGHPTVVHGGLTSAIFDETFGALLFNMRREGQVAFHRVYTARLEVDYVTPLPAQSTILCTARVQSFEGRKLWLEATVSAAPCGSGDSGSGADGADGVQGEGGAAAGGGGAAANGDAAAGSGKGQLEQPAVYARSRSLFVIPRGDPSLAAAADGGAATAGGAAANGAAATGAGK